MRNVRLSVRIAAVLAALVALIAITVAVLFNSQSFSRWLVNTAAQRSGGTIAVAAVEGTLGGGLRIGQLEVELDSANVVAADVELRVDWRSLVARSVIVDYINVARLDAALLQSESSQDIEPNELSILVLIRRIFLGELNVVQDDAQYLFSETAFELRVLRNRFELNDFSGVYEQLALSGRASVTLTDSLAVDSTICVDGVAAGEPILGCIDGVGSLPEVQVDAQLRQPFTISGTGTIALEESGAVDLEISWQDAALLALPDARSPQGNVQIEGTIARPEFVAEGSVAYSQYEADVIARAAVEGMTVELQSLQLTDGDLSAELSGATSTSFDSGEFDVRLAGVNPQRWLAQWPGDLIASAEVAYTTSPSLSLDADDIVVRGQLRGNPIAGVGALRYSQDSVLIENFQLVSRSDQISVNGQLASDANLTLAATINDLSLYSDDFGGALTADLHISGTADQPQVDGAVDLNNILAEGFAIETLRVAGSVGIAPEDPINLSASAVGLTAGNTNVSSLLFDVSGSAAEHRMLARLTAESWSSQLTGDGAFAGSDWSGRIAELDFLPDGLGLWRLRVPAEISYGAAGYSVSESCLAYQLSSICGSVAVSGGPEDALNVSAINFDLGILAPFAPEYLSAKGLINATAALTDISANPRGEISVEADDAQIDLFLAEDTQFPIPIVRFEFDALLEDDGASISAQLDAAEVGNAAAVFLVDDPLREDSPVSGSVNVQWHDASLLSLLSPDVDGVRGELAAELRIDGTLDQPVPTGSAGWSDGRIEVPAWGLAIEQIDAAFLADGNREAEFEAQGLVEGSPIEIDGSVLLDAEAGWPMQLALSGTDLFLVQLAEIQMSVSPDLQATVQLPDIRVNGTVTIPSAQIRDLALPEQAVVPSADTIVHGREVDSEGRPLNVVADLVLELGDDVTYQDASLSAAATGRLNLAYQSGEGAAAQGALRLTGEYDAYGNPLVLQRGELIFVGPLENPSLDILAVRDIGEVTAGVQLTGTLRAPITSVFSDPVMSEADALGWLLFGRPLDGSQESDSTALRNAAFSMGLQQALPVIERIGESLRLDDFAIRSTEADAGALMAGKYLSPNLYFRYSYGLFNRIGGLLLRYRINDQFSLETRSGEQSSMDLLYTREKD